MSDATTSLQPAQTHVRPFPWFCPHCRRKEVRRATIPYECSRVYNGKPITIVVANLRVPRCNNCGTLVFGYEAEEQINQAYQAQTRTSRNSAQAAPNGPKGRGGSPAKRTKRARRRKE